jgi:DNA-binding beta-propeller fold protein YncE
MHLVSERRGAAFGAVALAVALAALLWMASGARAETLYWDNYGDNITSLHKDTLSHANIDGTGAGELSLAPAELDDPEGLALDVAGGRLFAASSAGGPEEEGQIVFTRLDGTGGGVLNTAGAPVDDPEGIAIDPATGIVYWANDEGAGPQEEGSIGWARLDGTGGGELNTTGTTVEEPYKLAVDVVHGRVYWVNSKPAPETIGFANLNNSGGGGTLSLGAVEPESITAVVVDPAANRVYWLNDEAGSHVIGFTSTVGGGSGELSTANAQFNGPYGMAFDPTIGRFYWGNYNGNSESPENAIGFLDLSGAGGGISISGAPVHGPQDPVVYKSPIGAGAPTVAHAAHSAALTCSQGTWADFPGSFVYATPKSYAYSWTLNGAPVAGAATNALTATAAGTYACTVTATNDQGSAAQTSAGVAVNAANLAVSAKKKAKAKPGKAAVFKVKLSNGGDLATAPAKLCAKLNKKAKKGLKAPKCAKVPPIAAGATATAKLKVKVKKSAKSGAYKLSLVLKGATGNTVKAKVVVKGAKKHHK